MKFYPILNNIYSAYVLRFEKPEGRYWENVVGQIASPEDQEFVEHRFHFICYEWSPSQVKLNLSRFGVAVWLNPVASPGRR